MTESNTNDRRTFPRGSLKLDHILEVSTTSRPSIQDISAGGACFHSTHKYHLGEVINIIYESRTFGAIVLECEMEEPQGAFLEAYYRLRCKFVNPLDPQSLEALEKFAE